MSEELRMWVEVAFNVSYLLVIWALVILMITRREQVRHEDRPVSLRLTWMFALLAFGDTGHVGFRVLAYALGGLYENPLLVGLGSLSTAYTVTLFYMLLVDVWRLRFHRPLGWAGWGLLAVGGLRLLLMLFPQNGWDQVEAPYAWSLARNMLLTIQGLGVMALILRDSSLPVSRTARPRHARRAGAVQPSSHPVSDPVFRAIGWCIAASFAFYAPVILWVLQVPMLGMLMIPKTLAYVAVAVIAYRALYRSPSARQVRAVGAE